MNRQEALERVERLERIESLEKETQELRRVLVQLLERLSCSSALVEDDKYDINSALVQLTQGN